MSNHTRCRWAESDPLLQQYHDEEWGRPVHDSRLLWEMLMLEGFQAGLSWLIVLRKRQAFTQAFAEFEPQQIAAFGPETVEQLLQNPGIIRARAKIEAVIHNAKMYLTLQQQGQDFSHWLWSKVDNTPIASHAPELPQSPLSQQLSRELKKLGFKFVGPVIVHSWLQAVGVINDHQHDCFCLHQALSRTKRDNLDVKSL
ncbi:DNA-3-methyladenine glycosylase I [Shewanella sp.]|uniref:DNA-3-methyladenine glycosylase I n=1 Tax=Shewanella sp. TaxID=50422 RepID=UPI003D0CFA68